MGRGAAPRRGRDARSEPGRRRVATSSWPPSTRRYQRLLAEAGLVDFGDQIHRTLALLRERPALLARAARALPLHPGRRVPGHEPRPARAAAAARGRGAATSRSSATTTRRSTAGAAPRPRTCSPSASLYPGAREVVLDREPPLDAADPRRRRPAHPLQQPVPARGRGRDRQAPALAAAGAAPPVRHLALRHRLGRGRRRRRARRGAARSQGAARATSRSWCAATPTPIRSCARSTCSGIPHRFSGSRGLYAREEVRLLVSFLRVLANPDDSVSLFYLAASELYRLPETDLLRLNHYARRKTPPAARGAARRCPRTKSWPSVGGAAARGGGAPRRRPRAGRGGGAAPAHRRGALRLPAVRRDCSARLAQRGDGRERGARSRTSRASSRP